MRDLISAFSGAAKRELVAAGWSKRRCEIYTMAFGGGIHGWLGLNGATRYHPMKIDPVVGVRHEPLMRLVAELTDNTRAGTSATLATPIGYVTRQARFLELEIATAADAIPRSQELLRLLDEFGLPFIRALARPSAIESALRERRYLPIPDSALIRLPALLAVSGRHADALNAIEDADRQLVDRSDGAADSYRRFGMALRAWIRRPAAS